MQLLNNGTETITLHTNGAFSFANAVDSGGTYEVWVSQQPLNPLQFCVVSNRKGSASSNVTNIQVVCNTPAEQTLYNFGQQPDGINPIGTPVFDNLGNLYGVTQSGGSTGKGTVFMLTPSNGQWTKTVLYTFCPISGCADGSEPGAGLIWDAAGNLYGTTKSGGAFGGIFGGGTVFKLSKNGSGTWTETVLHSFGNGTDGNAQPDGISGLVFDTSGNLYGVTADGGNGGICGGLGCGTAFELSPNPDGSWTESVIYNFCFAGGYCLDGAYPMGRLAIDAAGNLYGTTWSGGGDAYPQAGTVYQLTSYDGGQWIEKVLYAFPVVGGGFKPSAGVILDTAGNLYGTTGAGDSCPGGCTNAGTVFELAQGTGGQWQEALLYSFDGTLGAGPSAPLVFDKAGNLYGTTTGGGPANAGAVFALSPTLANFRWTGVPLYGFGYIKNGNGPVSGLAMDAQGNLYGVGAALGTDGNGIVFRVTP
jgi:uncharacterized repeat protein (TIGR03803 family)